MGSQEIVEFRMCDAMSLGKVREESIVENETIQAFHKELQAYVDTHPGTVLHLDLSQVRFFSSAVLSDLLQIQQALRQTNGRLCLDGVHGNVWAIMKLTRMDRSFSIEHPHARQERRRLFGSR